MDQEIGFTTNQKGNTTLVHGEHRYNKSKTNKGGSTLWRCVNKRDCSATLSLDRTRRRITRKTRHTCGLAEAKNIIHEHIEFLKKKVCQDLRPVQIIVEENEAKLRRKVPDSDHDLLPSFRSIKDSLYRARKKFLNTDRLHHTSTETVTVPEVLGKKFLICEEGELKKF